MICIRRVCFIIFCICTFLPFSNFAAAPVNDNCTIATTISDVTNNCFAIDMNNATFDIANGNCALNPTDVNIWYSFIATGTLLDISLSIPGAEVALVRFNVSPCQLINSTDATELACVTQIIPRTQVVVGQQYFILISAVDPAVVVGNLCINNYDPPVNDDPCDAIAVTPNGPCVNGTTIGADPEYNVGICPNNDIASVWYYFDLIAPNRDITVSVQSMETTTYSMLIGRFPGDNCAATLNTIASSGDEYCGMAPGNIVLSGLQPGRYYYQIGTNNAQEGPFCTTVGVSPPPPGCATNENCSTPTNLPTPVTPAPGVTPVPICIDGCNISAFPTGFTSGACANFNSPVSWYTVTTDATANRLSITVNSTAGLTTPLLVLMDGGCPGVGNIIQCVQGTGGTAQINNYACNPSTQYIIGVLAGAGPTGRFTLCVNTFFAGTACATGISPLTVTSTSCGSPLNGPYIPGERVSFTYAVTNYSGAGNCQWIKALIPSFGPGWDPASFQSNGRPVTGTGPGTRYGPGTWQWIDENIDIYQSPLPNANLRVFTDPITGRLRLCHISNIQCMGTPVVQGTLMPAGWFFIRSGQTHPNGTGAPSPGNSTGYGDGSSCSSNAGPWTLTFTLQVREYSGPNGCAENPTATNLGVEIYPFADGQVGSYGAFTACDADFPSNLSPQFVCQASAVDEVPDITICSGGSFQTPQAGPFTIGGVPITNPVTWTVVAPAGVTGASGGAGLFIAGTLTNTTNSPKTVVYSVFTSAIPGCGGRTDVRVTVLPAINVLVQANATTGCARSTFKIWAVVTGDTLNYNYQWNNGQMTRTIFVTPNISGIYTVIVTDNSGSGCQYSGSIRINVNQLFPVVITMPDSIFCKENGPKVMTATSLGQFGVQGYRWTAPGSLNNATTRTLSLSQVTHTGVYTVTVTDVNGCTGTSSTEAFVNMAPLTFLSPNNPARRYEFCRTDPDSLKRFSIIPTPAPGNTVIWTGEYFGDENYGQVNIRDITSPHKLKILLIDGNGCKSSDSLNIILIDPPNIVFGPIQGPFCASKSPVQLTATPVGGTWSGSVSATGIVDPMLLGPGQYFAFYSVTVGGCTAIDTLAFIVEPFPRAALKPAGPFCLTDAPYQLQSDSTNGVWTGAGVSTTGLFSPSVAGVGTHLLRFTYAQRECQFTDTLYVIVKPVPTAGFTATTPICINQNSTIVANGPILPNSTFNWNFGGGVASPGGTTQGPHTVTWGTPGLKTIFLTVSLNGCNSTVATSNVTVDQLTAIPSIVCDSIYTTGIRFKWNSIIGNSGYQVYIDNNLVGTITDTIYTATSLTPNSPHSIRVIAINNGPCGNSESTLQCTTLPCPNINLSINPISTFCLYPNTSGFNLSATVTGGFNNGPLLWSGTGITNAAIGTFDPLVAGAGAHNITLTYMEQACTYKGVTLINIVPKPSPNFNIAAEICQDSITRVSYTGSAEPPSSTYFWIFDGGIPATSNGQGPHDVAWASPGIKNVQLIVNNGICADTIIKPITVIRRLQKPIIGCANTKRTITFSWLSIPGATGYTIQIGNNPPIITTDTFFLITGLIEGEARFIKVFANGVGVCGNSVADTLTCTAGFCPPVRTLIDPIVPICLTGNNSIVSLTYTLSGATPGSGTLTWRGPGISNANINDFNPNIAGPGLHKIYAEFIATGGECIYLDSINIQVTAPSFADFNLPTTACKDAVVSVGVLGTLPNGVNASFNFGSDSNPNTAVGPNPHSVSWSTAGSKLVTLTLNNGVCVTDSIKSIIIENPLPAPIVSCRDTFTTVTFSWNNIAGATGYSVVYNGNTTVVTDTFFVINNLNPGTLVNIQVTAIGNGACGNSNLTNASCTSRPCPNVTLDLAPVDTICLINNIAAEFNLTYSLFGNGNGQVSWASTPAGAVSNMGVFDPTKANIGQNKVVITFTEDVCIYKDSITFIVQNTPVADFNISNTACLTDIVSVSFTGQANPTAVFKWNFDNANILSGTGSGPYQLRWNSGGNKTISLQIVDGQCVSTTKQKVINIILPLEKPDLNCRGYNDSIAFNWPLVAGATGYQIIVDNNAPFVQTNNRYTATGLTVGTWVQLIVTAIGNPPCGNSVPDTVSCKTNDCPAVDPRVDSVNVCFGAKDTLQLKAIFTPVAGNTFSWGPANLFSDTTNGIFNVNAAGVGTHRVIFYQRVRSCVLTAFGYITVKPVPIPQISGNTTICKDSLLTLTNIGVPYTGMVYDWVIPSGNFANGSSTSPIIDVTYPITGWQKAVLSLSLNGCTGPRDTLDILVQPPLGIPIIDCAPTLDSITFTWPGIAGATGYRVYVNNSPTPIIQNNTDYVVRGLQEGDAVFIRVVAISGNTCGNSSDTITCVSKKCPVVNLEISGAKDVCLTDVPSAGFKLNISGTGSGTGRWTGAGVDSSGFFDPNIAGYGSHQVTYRYVEEFCPFTTTKTILVYPPPIAVIQGIDPSCFGNLNGQIIIGNLVSAKPPVLISFNNGPFNAQSSYLNLAPGSYPIVIQDATGCETKDTVTLINPPPLSVDLGPDRQIFVGDSVLINPIINLTAGDTLRSFVWTVNGIRDSIWNTIDLMTRPVVQTNYGIVITNSYGCTASDNLLVIVKRNRRIYIPNVFSPNLDKVNSVFKIYGGDEVEKINFLRIFNRWGEMLYEERDFLADNSQRGWDGYFRGSPLKPAVFVYVVEILFKDGTKEIITGDLTLINSQ